MVTRPPFAYLKFITYCKRKRPAIRRLRLGFASLENLLFPIHCVASLLVHRKRRLGIPGRNRTYVFDLRRVLFYPLNYRDIMSSGTCELYQIMGKNESQRGRFTSCRRDEALPRLYKDAGYSFMRF